MQKKDTFTSAYTHNTRTYTRICLIYKCMRE